MTRASRLQAATSPDSVSPMNETRTVEIRVTFPKHWDAEAFVFELFQCYAEANGESFPEDVAAISYEISEGGLLVGGGDQ